MRRGIARKKPEILEEAMPKIMDGYCSKSDHLRDIAENECQEFLQIIEDASSYMFGYNHSIAYCLLGYLCAYYRYYHPIEFITAFLNNAANDDDLKNGAVLAKQYGIEVTSPKFGISQDGFSFDKDRNTIAKGMASIKHVGRKVAREIYSASHSRAFDSFTDVLQTLYSETSIDSQQISILIHIDFFSDFGNQRELDRIISFWEFFKRGSAKSVKRSRVEGSYIEDIIRRHSTDRRKDGSEAASYTLQDVDAILRECEAKVLSLGLDDYGLITRARSFNEAMGYNGFISGRDQDRSTLFVKDVMPVRRKKDGKLFGYGVLTQSLGSGIESRFTVFKEVYQQDPIRKDDVIRCLKYRRDSKGYFTMERYVHLMAEDPMAELE